MHIFTTCRDCSGLLQATNPDDTVHPNCRPKPVKVERLAQEWLAAAESGSVGVAEGLQQLIDDLDSRPPRLLDAALHYATKYHWPVFPLRPREKRPATRNGFKDATCDPDRIRAWWNRHPDSNIGLPTGHRFDVIDIDVPDGVPSLMSLAHTDVEVHGQVATSSGGTHLYVCPTGRGNTARSLPGVDYRGAGGYVVAPPSTLGPRGRAWGWVHRPSPVLTGLGDTYDK